MRKIVLHGPAADRRGQFRDAGDTLTVGAAGNEESDVSTDVADDLIARGVAVTLTEDREADAAAEAQAPAEPVLADQAQPAASSAPRRKSASAAD